MSADLLFPTDAEKKAGDRRFTQTTEAAAIAAGKDAQVRHSLTRQHTEDIRIGLGADRLNATGEQFRELHKDTAYKQKALSESMAASYKNKAITAARNGNQALSLVETAKHDEACGECHPGAISDKRLELAKQVVNSTDNTPAGRDARTLYGYELGREMDLKKSQTQEARQAQGQHRSAPFQAAQDKAQGRDHVAGQAAQQQTRQALDRAQTTSQPRATAASQPQAAQNEKSPLEKAFADNMRAVSSADGSATKKGQDIAGDAMIRDIESDGAKGASARQIFDGMKQFHAKDTAFGDWQRETRCKSLKDMQALKPEQREEGMKLFNAAVDQRKQIVELGKTHEASFAQKAEKSAGSSAMDAIRAIRDRVKDMAQTQTQTQQKKQEHGQAR
jgi:hypothetical protein